MDIKELLDKEILKRNTDTELSLEKPDPLMVAKEQRDDMSILTCALFAYGNAKQIVKFLQSLPFDLNDRSVSEKTIRDRLHGYKYRFQNEEDIIQWFLIIQRIRNYEKENQKGKNPKESLLELTFLNSYEKNKDIVSGIYACLDLLDKYAEGYSSSGFKFLIGIKNTNSPLKRWNMFLRWMVRKDELDLGFWKNVDKKDLIVPLDTHTFELGKKLGLIERKSYDMKSAIELTNSFKTFDINDPVKYDFALYRLGQEKSFKTSTKV